LTRDRIQRRWRGYRRGSPLRSIRHSSNKCFVKPSGVSSQRAGR
jgi:hypothetical protein